MLTHGNTAKKYQADLIQESGDTIGAFVAAKPYITVPLDCPIDTVLTIMSHSGKRVAGVINDNGILQGFLTRSNLFGKLVIEPGFDVGVGIDASIVKALRAEDVMMVSPAFLPSELGVKDAMAIMSEHGFHYMPVLGDDARLVGIADLGELSAAEEQDNEEFDSEANLAVHMMRPGLQQGVPYGIGGL